MTEGGLGSPVPLATWAGVNPPIKSLQFVRGKIRSTVNDPQVAELLCPDQVIGCKRVCVDTDYYKTYNKENVTLINVRDTPIERLTKTGLIVDNTAFDFDMIIFATGFDAMTGSLLKIDVTGREGVKLADKWAADPPPIWASVCMAFLTSLWCQDPVAPAFQHDRYHRAACRLYLHLSRLP